jgi:Arc/MetJ family transcription regulator
MTRKTTVELHEELLARAQKVLGTHGVKATIEAALYEVVAADARRKTIARLEALDVDADELRRQAWGS